MAEEKNQKERSLVPSFPEHIKSELIRQWELPWQERRMMISGPEGIVQKHVDHATAVAKMYHLPLDTMAIVKGKPYIMERGVVWRLQWDPRGLKGIHPEIVQEPTPENNNTAIVKCTVSFQDGSEFVNYGSHSPASESNPNFTPDTLFMKCVTKSIRRAGLTATGIPFPMWEEFVEFKEFEAQRVAGVIEGEVVEAGKVLNLGQFLALCAEAGMEVPDEVVKKLGLGSAKELSEIDFQEALKKLGLGEER